MSAREVAASGVIARGSCALRSQRPSAGRRPNDACAAPGRRHGRREAYSSPLTNYGGLNSADRK
eukprot:1164765-Pyramimonas_sp.AAC.1